MLNIFRHKDFEKDYRKLQKGTKERFEERYELFMNNPFHPLLKNHPLGGKLKGRWSFSVEGDIRVIYRFLAKDRVLFMRIGSHNQVY